MRIKHFGKWIFSRVMLNLFQVDVYLFKWFWGVERNDNITVSSSARLPDGQAVENAFWLHSMLHPSTP
jgi:hypothetical protein